MTPIFEQEWKEIAVKIWLELIFSLLLIVMLYPAVEIEIVMLVQLFMWAFRHIRFLVLVHTGFDKKHSGQVILPAGVVIRKKRVDEQQIEDEAA